MIIMKLISLLIALISAVQAKENYCAQVVLRAAEGMNAVLPCGQGRVFLDGPRAYTIWTKNSKFLQRFPNENDENTVTTREAMKELQKFPVQCEMLVTHNISIRNSLTMISSLDCIGDYCPDPTSLKLMKVGFQDAGVYRCRIDNEGSPRIDIFIELTVVDAPKPPRVWSDEYKMSGTILQLHVGSSVDLYCEVEGNYGDTLMWWERNGKSIEHVEMSEDGLLRSKINIDNASRSEANAHYECLVQNADITPPVMTSVVIKMNLEPIYLEIRLNENLEFEAGVPRVVDCVVVGCMPPPEITWHLGTSMLRSNVHKEQHKGNFTISSLTLVPSLRDDRRILTCRAHNFHLVKQFYETQVTINVGFRPICANENDMVIGVVPGERENVECSLESHPDPKEFSWTFADGKTLYTNSQKVEGHIYRYSSILSWIPGEDEAGRLECGAKHILGSERTECLYSVLNGGPPQAPSCYVTRYYNLVHINCQKNWDGGRTQLIHLELRQQNGNVVYHEYDTTGNFDLKKGEIDDLIAFTYATNSRGRSTVRQLDLNEAQIITSTAASRETEQTEGIYILCGIFLLGCLLVGFSIGGVMCFKSSSSVNSPCEAREGQEGQELHELQDADIESSYSNGSYRRESQLNPAVMEMVEMPRTLNEPVFVFGTKTRLPTINEIVELKETRISRSNSINEEQSYFV